MLSPSSRRAWIEIKMTYDELCQYLVALLAEGVDRNFPEVKKLLKGDLSPSSRRAWIEIFSIKPVQWAAISVALLAEGVDRNRAPSTLSAQAVRSPSSRRAWIEISWSLREHPLNAVALLAEGVDRNRTMQQIYRHCYVALLAEGVDRNYRGGCPYILVCRRPPRGGRG